MKQHSVCNLLTDSTPFFVYVCVRVFVYIGSYIKSLQHDTALRLRMGQAGVQSVSTRTIDHVVKELLVWYQVRM